ncbi:phosphinothricin n-acetyltransferase [hydrocarbon metagenome]|uniref:Phosphinothricin n-acetyltransferase n=1 Tax=hydrocarbon metagenome TaxID=938273 RepID=A0A0W8EA05_9ZZZZ
MCKVRFEQIEEEHLNSILDIYQYYVLNTTATFHDHALSVDEMKKLVFFDNSKYRTFIIIEDEVIAGYVILKRYKEKGAYDATAEVTVYLKTEYIGRRLGSLAVQYIESYAKTVGIHVLIAYICGENLKSINLFCRNGYFKCAHYKDVGRKFDQVLDVVAYQKILDE